MASTTSLPTNLNVLIVEDDENDAELMIAALRRSGIVAHARRVQTEADFRRALLSTPDAILSDYTVPGFGARRALEVCAELGLDIPFIVVTGSISEEVAVDCMKRGAADYLLKDRLARLGSALEQAVMGRSVRTQKQNAERARDAAMRELDHRVRNNLAVVVGLAELTIRGAESLDAFSRAFMGRVRALATVHDALGEHQWLHVDLGSLVMRLVQPHAKPSGGTFEIAGDPTPLAAPSVQPLGLVLHELSRDAVTQGPWSRPGGVVRVSWSVAPSPEEGAMIDLVWEEHSPGKVVLPIATETEARGINLVQSLVTHEMGGTLSVTPLPDGRRITITLPAIRKQEFAPLPV